jgi:hypothetical protein
MEEFQDTTTSIGNDFAASHGITEHACAVSGCEGTYINNGGVTNYMNYCPPCYSQFRIELDTELNSYIDNNPSDTARLDPDTNASLTFDTTATSDVASSTTTTSDATSSTAATSDATSSTAITSDATFSIAITSDAASSTSTNSDATSSIATISDATSSTATSSIPGGAMTMTDIQATLISLVKSKETQQSASVVIGIL